MKPQVNFFQATLTKIVESFSEWLFEPCDYLKTSRNQNMRLLLQKSHQEEQRKFQ